jgi:hypothetical protein
MAGSGFADELRAPASGRPSTCTPSCAASPTARCPRTASPTTSAEDYVFLVEYARMLALDAARAPDLMTMRRFAELAQAILGEEMDSTASSRANSESPRPSSSRRRAVCRSSDG